MANYQETVGTEVQQRYNKRVAQLGNEGMDAVEAWEAEELIGDMVLQLVDPEAYEEKMRKEALQFRMREAVRREKAPQRTTSQSLCELNLEP